MDSKRTYTSRYERYIHEQVKKLTVQEVGCAEALTAEQVLNIFERIESSKKKIGAVQND